jgi:hypothetical protein
VQVFRANCCSNDGQRYYSISIVYVFCGYTLCGTFTVVIRAIEINLITNYLVLASIKTIFFFALSIKLASEFLGSVGTTTIPLDAIKACGSIGSSAEM